MPIKDQIREPKSPSKLIGLPSYIVNILAVIFLSIVISTIVEWIGMYFNYWDEPNYLHAKNTFVTEINWVLGDALSSVQNMANMYSYLFEVLNQHLVEQSGLKLLAAGELSVSLLWMFVVSALFIFLANWTKFRDDIIMQIFLSILAMLPILFLIAIGIDYVFEIGFLKDYILALVYILQLTIVRVLTILFSLPVFVLLTLYIVADGMYQRQIRKLSGAMESSFVYHHSKRWIKPLIGLPIVLLLSSPVAIHPSIFVLVVTLTPGMFLLVSIKYFKKYL